MNFIHLFYFFIALFIRLGVSEDSQTDESTEMPEKTNEKFVKFTKLTLVEYEDENGEIWQTTHSETKKGDFSFEPNTDEPLLSVIRFRIETETKGQVHVYIHYIFYTQHKNKPKAKST